MTTENKIKEIELDVKKMKDNPRCVFVMNGNPNQHCNNGNNNKKGRHKRDFTQKEMDKIENNYINKSKKVIKWTKAQKWSLFIIK